jgi:GNAT superfamily N-acetyltransferase
MGPCDHAAMGVACRVAALDDLPAVTAVMATAFSADPAWGAYSFPDPQRRLAQSTAFWEPQLRASMRFSWTFVTPDCEAAAVWIPPGEPEMTAQQERDLVSLTEQLLGVEQARVVFDVFERLEASHPHDRPHYYLSLLGTHDDHRGKGLGMGLLAATLELIDAEHMPAYLESTNPDNDRRYMSHGFEPAGRVTLANGHQITTMWRQPR